MITEEGHTHVFVVYEDAYEEGHSARTQECGADAADGVVADATADDSTTESGGRKLLHIMKMTRCDMF